MDVSLRIETITNKMNTTNIEKLANVSPPGTGQINDINTYLKDKLNEAIKDHDNLLTINSELRKHYLVNKLKDINGWEIKNLTTLRSLMKREQIRQDFRYIRQQLKGYHGIGITSIDIPSTQNPGTWEKIIEPNRIVEELIQQNIIHFGQAKTTAFATPPISEFFGYKGTKKCEPAD
jgi:hypothetical protein